MNNYPRSQEVYGSFNLPFTRTAVNEGIRNLNSPYRLVWAAAIAVASLSVQAHVDVCLPRGHVVPVSLMELVVANSGEGKTAAESIFMKGVKKFELEERAKYASSMKRYREELEIFNVTRQALSTSLKRAITDGGDSDEAEEALKLHMRSAPVKPKLVRFCHEDATPEAMIASVAEHFPVAALFSSEGAGVLNGRAFSDLEKLCQSWSGGGFTVDRKSGPSFHIAWCRLMLSLMLQPGPLERYLESTKGQKAKELGFWARTLVFDTGSTQGSRMIFDNTVSWENCDLFSERVYELLSRAAAEVGKEGYSPEVLEFSPEASAHWFSIHNWIEEQMLPGGRYEHARDHATKLSDNIARVAAVLHYFEGFEGSISKDTLEIAQVICEDASMDYLKIFVPPPREFQDAQVLNEWLDRYRKLGASTMARNFARRNCPNALRKEGRFYIALDVLRRNGVVVETLDAKMTAYIHLNPNGYKPLKWDGALSGIVPVNMT